MRQIPILVITFLLLSQSCSPDDLYEVKEDESGRMIRLNKRTGEVAIIGSDALRILKSTDEIEAEAEAERLTEAALREPKRWPPQEVKQIGVDTATLITSWRDGKLYYQLVLRPVPKKYEENRFKDGISFFVGLVDGAGFTIKEIRIPLAEFSNTLGADGEIVSIKVNTSISCSKNDYTMMEAWSPEWSTGLTN